MTHLCPHCGFDLQQDQVIERDGFRLDPRGQITFEGRVLRTRPAHAMILYTLAKADGRPITGDMLMSRVGSEGTYNVVAVQICQLRRALREQGAPSPISTDFARGYRWQVEQSATAGQLARCA